MSRFFFSMELSVPKPVLSGSGTRTTHTNMRITRTYVRPVRESRPGITFSVRTRFLFDPRPKDAENRTRCGRRTQLRPTTAYDRLSVCPTSARPYAFPPSRGSPSRNGTARRFGRTDLPFGSGRKQTVFRLPSGPRVRRDDPAPASWTGAGASPAANGRRERRAFIAFARRDRANCVGTRTIYGRGRSTLSR